METDIWNGSVIDIGDLDLEWNWDYRKWYIRAS